MATVLIVRDLIDNMGRSLVSQGRFIDSADLELWRSYGYRLPDAPTAAAPIPVGLDADDTAHVAVVTGTEPRPAAPFVIWVGGATQPVNMQDGVLWLMINGGATPDTTPPSTPTGLVASNITSSGFTVSWTASSDNIATTGYDVQIGGVSVATPTGTSQAVTGCTANTDYSVAVRARDAAGNWSALSTPLVVHTAAATGTPQHHVFQTPPVTVTENTDGTPYIRVANGFYTFNSAAASWRVRGMRIYIPTGATATSAACAMHQTMIDSFTPDLSVTTTTKTMPSLTAGAWNEILWDTPVAVTPGSPFWLSYDLGGGKYLAGTWTAGDNFTVGYDTPNLIFAERTVPRGAFRIGTNTTTANPTSGGTWYGIDVIVDEGP